MLIIRDASVSHKLPLVIYTERYERCRYFIFCLFFYHVARLVLCFLVSHMMLHNVYKVATVSRNDRNYLRRR